MRNFFYEYLAMPLSVLMLFFIAPTVMVGGVKLTETLFGSSPACEVRE